ncbi:tetratricopeptide repeat protein [Pinibacter aurantiacus]|uniref:Tetratricopeptide repeat protein n=1 Tax=Pinibacter aurantiacus TaxID=2851599 RepID=A0A9E2SE09_9BACT|nr:hypothetical protein [Pinibacter aurantiacus]MBV4358820.1 hypothetical protein [Pinibacter aurantiacus]
MMTRQFLIVAAALLVSTGLWSQDVNDVSKDIYHERYAPAKQKLLNILSQSPSNEEALYLLTQVYLQNDSVQTAKAKLLSAPPAALDQPIVMCAMGHLLLRQDSADAAKIYFDKALDRTKSKNPHVLNAIAKAELDAKSGDANYGLSLLEKAFKRDKNNPELYVTKGDLYRKLGNGSESYKAYQEALAKNETYAAAIYKIGKIFATQGNKDVYVNYFDKAVSNDSMYAPALYEMYYHYYFKDVNKAREYLDKYIAASGKSVKTDYLVTDLLFSSQKYGDAIDHAGKLLALQGAVAEPRLYKLMAYSYSALHKNDSALAYMKQYFKLQNDTNYVAKDFEAMGAIYDSIGGKQDSAMIYYEKALVMEKDTVQTLKYYKKFANIYKEQKDYTQEAKWLGKYYETNTAATNVDLFNWGIASYKAGDYPTADSVFTKYETKYPEQSFGYYWAARVTAAIDTSMENGLAIPHYEKLIELIKNDSTDKTNRKYLIEAYGYIAAYEANVKKDYRESIEYFEKLLALDPSNEDARKYVEVLQKHMVNGESSKN